MSNKPYHYTVSQLNLEAKTLLEQGLPPLWVEGEISNLATPASGHWYLTLKDSRAQVRAAMFKARNRLLRQVVKNGDKVLVRGRVSLYEARGDYQFIIEQMQSAGEGLLRLQFDELKRKLEAEGLFAENRKQALPAMANKIGVISSPSGAVVHDIITAAKRRCASTEVIIYPAAVQGDEAAAQLRLALKNAILRNEVDAIIIGRGGGSLEDLWAFNDEALAREIADCPIPIISAVGHEVDYSISDWVADVRAPTPTAAAELLTPNGSELLNNVKRLQQRLTASINLQLHNARRDLKSQQQRLNFQNPQRRLEQIAQQIDRQELQLRHALRQQLTGLQQRLAKFTPKLAKFTPQQQVSLLANRNQQLSQRLAQAQGRLLQQPQNKLAVLSAKLHTVSPLATLQRGYAIAQTDNDKVLLSHKDASIGDSLKLRLRDGELDCQVTDARQL